jgi:hypothetical protein
MSLDIASSFKVQETLTSLDDRTAAVLLYQLVGAGP